MLAMRREIFCSHMEEDREEVAEHEFRFEDIAAQPVALVKAAAETTTRFVKNTLYFLFLRGKCKSLYNNSYT